MTQWRLFIKDDEGKEHEVRPAREATFESDKWLDEPVPDLVSIKDFDRALEAVRRYDPYSDTPIYSDDMEVIVKCLLFGQTVLEKLREK